MLVKVIEQVRLQTPDQGVVYPELGAVMVLNTQYAQRLVEAGHVVPFRVEEEDIVDVMEQVAETLPVKEEAEPIPTPSSSFRAALRSVGISVDLIDTLIHNDLNSLSKLSAAHDAAILGIRGIATVTLRKVRLVAPKVE